MEEIKLWTIDGSQVEELKPTGQAETEKLLEDALVRQPDLLMEDLSLIGRQTPTKDGWLDLLGVDGDGRLVVFELKRGTLSRDAVAQVIDYASDLDRMELDELANHISQNSGNHDIDKIVNFRDWYSQSFEGEKLELESLKPIRMYLVGLGVDDRTERMVRFLSENGKMDISLLTFHGFKMDGKTLLAKQMEVGIDPPPEGPPSREQRWQLLSGLVDEYGITEMHKSIREMFNKNWPESHQIPVRHKNPPYGKSINVKFGKNTYVRLDIWDGGMGLAFYSRSVALNSELFRRPIQDIRYSVWPKNNSINESDTQIYFTMNTEEWAAHKALLTNLVQGLHQAWQDGGK